MNTKERLSVLETKVDQLSEQSRELESKVDTLIVLVDKGNFDKRISKLERNQSSLTKWLVPIFYTVGGAIMTFLFLEYLRHL